MSINRMKDKADDTSWRAIAKKIAVILGILAMVLWLPATFLNAVL
ncbi:hypothetical protein EGH25_00800 [Haladaptatus sp. F3-133]|jgi:hypothetical protein|uniref:Uncharacterized protein n=1 Tax=Halorutilus salinus TaxID=2487751 RepID=A0A9Q4C2K6_9EURY|nr:hypothetical protein [Halorutilus salinus]MCX2817901.1 hypothetical protein [Halorutilus salinus]